MLTNKTIQIYSKNKSWDGDYNAGLVGKYDVYLEEHSSRETFKIDYGSSSGPLDVANTSKGFFILQENIDLSEKTITYDDNSFVIANWDRYFDMYGDFHHIEADFK